MKTYFISAPYILQSISNYNLRQFTFLLLLTIVSVAFLGLISNFVMVGFWSTALAIIFWSLNQKIKTRLNGKDNLAAAITTILILLLVVVPFGLITIAIVNQSEDLYQQIQGGQFKAHHFTDILFEYIPGLQGLLERFDVNMDTLRTQLNNSAADLAGKVGGQVVSYTQNILNLFLDFFMMLYLLFFFLRDGDTIVKSIGDAFPLREEIEQKLFYRFASVTRATLRGTLIVAMVQGAIGGILFWAVGIEAAVLWGVLMTLLALLPIGGSAIVWFPAAIIMFFEGQTSKAAIILLVGALIIGLIDNLLRPQLVGRETQMPDYLILLATLGGISWVGLAGFVIGPIIAAFFITCWQILGQSGNLVNMEDEASLE